MADSLVLLPFAGTFPAGEISLQLFAQFLGLLRLLVFYVFVLLYDELVLVTDLLLCVCVCVCVCVRACVCVFLYMRQ